MGDISVDPTVVPVAPAPVETIPVVQPPVDPIPADKQTLIATIASFLKMVFDKFFNSDTTVGKSGKVAFWSGLSVAILAIAAAIAGNPLLFSWHSGILVVIANVILIAAKNFGDPTVKNF